MALCFWFDCQRNKFWLEDHSPTFHSKNLAGNVKVNHKFCPKSDSKHQRFYRLHKISVCNAFNFQLIFRYFQNYSVSSIICLENGVLKYFYWQISSPKISVFLQNLFSFLIILKTVFLSLTAVLLATSFFLPILILGYVSLGMLGSMFFRALVITVCVFFTKNKQWKFD